MRIATPKSTKGLVAYRSTQYFERLFCGTCGCHVFWREQAPKEDVAWAVATGVIEGLVDRSGDGDRSKEDNGGLWEPQYARHINVLGTRDGGLSSYLPEIRGRQMDDRSLWGEPALAVGTDDGTRNEDALPASCHCGNVSFHVTRPDQSSGVPKRGYSDLIHPFCSTPAEIVANPEDEKWWLRAPRPGIAPPRSQTQDSSTPTRYLAGTCACRSCRLISGFEVQSWAFVPRGNIFWHMSLPDTHHSETAQIITPLDFKTLPPGILKSYHSSPGVVREFCANCGATVFWRDDEGAEVVDVSAGLFDAIEGTRAEDWLEWWTGRVSFAEETRTGRSGEVAARAEGLIDSLERGMRKWAQSGEQ